MGIADIIEKTRATKGQTQKERWYLLRILKGFTIAKYLSNAIIAIKHNANTPPILIIAIRNLQKNVLYNHLHVLNNRAAIIISTIANIKSANAKSATIFRNLPLPFQVVNAINKTSVLPSTPKTDTVTLTAPSTLSRANNYPGLCWLLAKIFEVLTCTFYIWIIDNRTYFF